MVLTKVKGVDIILNDDIWENVAQFPIHDGTSPILTVGIEGFNRIFAYRSFLRRPAQEIGMPQEKVKLSTTKIRR